MLNYLLPIGTVVMLKKGNKKLMIIGVKQMEAGNPDVVYDYIGVIYPEGYLGENAVFLFNHDAILDVVHEGYKNPEFDDFVTILGKIQEEMEKTKDNNEEDE